MSQDLLLELSKNPTASKLIKNLGLPIPMPIVLRRAKGPMAARPLADLNVVVASGPNATLTATLARDLAEAGANPLVHSSTDIAPFKGPGEAFGRPAVAVSNDDAKQHRAHGFVFDATGVATVAELRSIYDFFQPWLRSLGRNGRVVVIGRPADTVKGAEAAAAQAALEGFVRSISKEVSELGATANGLFVEAGAEARVAGPLRYLLSERSVYMNGQPMIVRAEVKGSEAPRWERALDGKVALVTGAARGIGEQIARLMADEGAHVVVLDRPNDEELATRVARSIGGSTLLLDITAPDAPAQIAEHFKAKFGGIDLVVHNAGVTRDKTLKNMKPEYWDQAVDINLGAVIRINDTLISSGALRDNARIVCLSSVSGIAGNRGQTNYSAAKSGLISYVQELGHQLAASGGTVNAIAPGFIETRLTAAMPVANREVARRMNSLGQGGQPEDVAQAVMFLTTPGSAGVTGNTIRVCGGMLIGA